MPTLLRRGSLLLACLFLFLSGCEKPMPVPPPQADNVDQAALQKLDVCSLLNADEVAAIQSSPVKQAKGSSSGDGRFLTRQCFYETTDFNSSVNLALTSRDPSSPTQLSPGAFWKEKFAPYRSGAPAEETTGRAREDSGDAEGERHDPPKKIEGVGDEAFWMGPDALYVLHRDVYLRLSVGGSDSAEIKIKKATELMKSALGRLAAAISVAEKK